MAASCTSLSLIAPFSGPKTSATGLAESGRAFPFFSAASWTASCNVGDCPGAVASTSASAESDSVLAGGRMFLRARVRLPSSLNSGLLRRISSIRSVNVLCVSSRRSASESGIW